MTPWLDDGDVRVYHGDCLDVMAGMGEESVDAIVCDPPYGLGFMGKDWDSTKQLASRPPSADETDARFNNAFPRTGKGPAAVAFDAHAFEAWCESWGREALRVLKPGGHLLAFGGTRTYHRLTCGLEDAGFEIRDCLAWLYGSGFPKSLDVSKAIDKAAGMEREVVGRIQRDSHLQNRYKDPESESAFVGSTGHFNTITAPATPEAARWEGWGTALKPAHEPIVVARKPLVGTVAATVLEYGTGALNIDGCRVPKKPGDRTDYGLENGASAGIGYHGLDGRTPYDGAAGRWPANVVLDEQAADALDEQTGELHSQDPRTRASRSVVTGVTGFTTRPKTAEDCYGDAGGASRFFYTAKASPAERNGSRHPTVKPLDLMRWLVRLVTPPGGLVLDPFVGSGTTLEAARAEGFRAVGIEREAEYLPDIARRLQQLSLLGGAA